MALGIDGVRVGVYTDRASATGCTVVLPPGATRGGIAVRGGAPGTREAAALGPTGTVGHCHGVVLCGSSLFGLAAAEGVVDWCVRHGRGLRLAGGVFPIVGAAVVQDIRGPRDRRIDRGSGWAACAAAAAADPEMGRVGAGAGCTVGKEAGPDWASPGGQGWAARRAGDLSVAALMVVNALGSVYDEQGRLLAGCRAPESVERFPLGNPGFAAEPGLAAANTVIGCIVTNACLSKAGACRVADLGHSGIARAVSPAHTSLDGDTLFCLATGEVEAPLDAVSHLAAETVAAAVRAGVRA